METLTAFCCEARSVSLGGVRVRAFCFEALVSYVQRVGQRGAVPPACVRMYYVSVYVCMCVDSHACLCGVFACAHLMYTYACVNIYTRAYIHLLCST